MAAGENSPPGLLRRWSGATLGLALLAVLVAVNGVAIGAVLDARRSARDAARIDLELETQVHARSLEAAMANLRADLAFLAQSPPIAQLAPIESERDPMVRRWQRLDAESTLLLFFVPQPALQRVSVEAADGRPLMVVGRLDGVPQILSTPVPGDAGPDASRSDPIPQTTPPDVALLEASSSIGSPEVGRLRAWIDPSELISQVAVGLEDRLRLEARQPSGDARQGEVQVSIPLSDAAWTPSQTWWLTRSEPNLQVVQSFEDQTRRYRTVLALNLIVVLLTLGLGYLAFRQARDNARLEAENAQQARVRELERSLMHSERLASVGRLAAGMAHEINNPLEGMANYLTVLEEDLDRGDLEQATEWTPRLRQGLDRAAGVLRQVLAFSDPGKGPKEAVDLSEAVAETVNFVASNPAFRSVPIRWRKPDHPIVVFANPTAVGQLVLNLLLNACEAQLENRGAPSESAVEVTCDTDDAGRAVLVVADHGPGFDPEVLDHLFEPFFSGRGSSGLGLAVCHGIVQDVGGTITASNREGGGARLRIELPMRSTLDEHEAAS